MKLKDIFTREKQYNRPIKTFIKGLNVIIRAWRLVIKGKGLKKYFIIPFFLNLILLTLIYYISYLFIYPEIASLLPHGAEWYLKIVRWFISPLIIILLALICVLIYSITGTIITALFNDLLSSRVESLLTGLVLEEKFSISILVKDIARITQNILKLFILVAFINFIIYAINFIPIVGIFIYSILSFMSFLFFLGAQFFDFPLERRGLKFGDKLKVLWEYRYMKIGLGLGF